jgi:mono/diheme cytochrome c family protein
MNEENKNPEELPPLLGDPDREDVYQIHRALLEREKVEPKDGFEPAPWWVWTVGVIVIFSMGYYLGRYSGSFTADPHELYEKTGPVRAAAVGAAPSGQMVFEAVCMTCHQEGGKGLEDQFPPLAGSEWVAKDAAAVVRILLDGLSGPIEVKGRIYNNTMPPVGQQLTDGEIAAVLTYVRSSWGNKAGPVDEALVKKLRAEAK